MNMTDPPYITFSGLLLGLGMSSTLPAINEAPTTPARNVIVARPNTSPITDLLLG